MTLTIDCEIWRNNQWLPAPLAWVKKGDWFRIPGSEDTHVANKDAFKDAEGWHVDADWHRRDKDEKTNARTARDD